MKQAAGRRVLLETPDKQPLLVSGEFGSGRTLAFAGESTYLWPLHGFEKEHKRFWRQVILWLVRRDDLNRDDVWIKLDQRRFNPGSRVHVDGRRPHRGGRPDHRRHARHGRRPSRRPPRAAPAVARQGRVERHVHGRQAPGDYAIETTASTPAGRELGTARAEFLVFDRDVELSNPAADPDLMASLAAWTKDEGGRAVAARGIAEAARRNWPTSRPNTKSDKPAGSSPAPAADAWLFFLALTGLLSVEWWLRKKWGLV